MLTERKQTVFNRCMGSEYFQLRKPFLSKITNVLLSNDESKMTRLNDPGPRCHKL